jgi:hypothetical protein
MTGHQALELLEDTILVFSRNAEALIFNAQTQLAFAGGELHVNRPTTAIFDRVRYQIFADFLQRGPVEHTRDASSLSDLTRRGSRR